ncbi:MAG: DUF4440 domain-containing protein [Cytophagales bacterium CG18_big_fil_WC_8_21_14_2_50_42_9]|nr:MAG: DUF4440 domain-containing protein [Cytophagales bacterium CG18_big_fil_WC_8_21_14_2_50_42_9]
MKKVLFLLLGICYLNIIANAQSKAEKQVAAAVEKLRLAMMEADKGALDQITMAELNYGHSSGKVENKAEFIQALTSDNSDFKLINLTGQTLQVIGKTALVRHLLTAETNDKGVPGTIKLAVLLVWQKQNGRWRLLARQAVKA